MPPRVDLAIEETDMRKDFTIGLVVPFAADTVPDEGLQMYPDVRFIPRGVGVRSLTPTGYDSACEAILPAAEYLAAQGVDAIMVIGTSLDLLSRLRLPRPAHGEAARRDGTAGEHHEPGGGRRAAQLRRAPDRGRDRLCRRRQQPAAGLPHARKASR